VGALVLGERVGRGLELPDGSGDRVGLEINQPQVHPQRGVRGILEDQVLVDLRRPFETARA